MLLLNIKKIQFVNNKTISWINLVFGTFTPLPAFSRQCILEGQFYFYRSYGAVKRHHTNFFLATLHYWRICRPSPTGPESRGRATVVVKLALNNTCVRIVLEPQRANGSPPTVLWRVWTKKHNWLDNRRWRLGARDKARKGPKRSRERNHLCICIAFPHANDELLHSSARKSFTWGKVVATCLLKAKC